MKIKNSIVSIAACVAVVTFVGCSKSNEPAPPGTNSTATATDAAKDMAGQAVDTAKDVAGQAAAAATNAVTSATPQFNDVVAKAKTYIADKKYTEALDVLNKLSGMVLTAEQQKTVDDLKAEATKLLSGGAVDAAKGLLGK